MLARRRGNDPNARRRFSASSRRRCTSRRLLPLLRSKRHAPICSRPIWLESDLGPTHRNNAAG